MRFMPENQVFGLIPDAWFSGSFSAFRRRAVLGLGWYPLHRHISPPAITLCEAENAAYTWLIDNKTGNSSPRDVDFFIRMVFYEKPEILNQWLKKIYRPNVSTNNGTEAKWYFEFACLPAQGVSHMCSVDTNKTVTLEWTRY